MKSLRSFLLLIRWPNLIFIFLTQSLFYFCVYQPLFHGESYVKLVWIILASVLIAAGGYIINDYFDLNIDQINKPNKNLFNKEIRRRWGILLHLIFSIAGILATIVAVGFAKWYLIIADIGCVALLWIYSTSLKRRYLIGNIVISLLTAWTVLILFFAFTNTRSALVGADPATTRLLRIAILYGSFAFIASLIREAVKDMEDIRGDAQFGCRTLPIVSGMHAAKIYVAIWTIILVASIAILDFYTLRFHWWPAISYTIVFLLAPLIILLSRLKSARSANDFHGLSRLSKFIMLAGILSMIFFRFYL